MFFPFFNLIFSIGCGDENTPVKEEPQNAIPIIENIEISPVNPSTSELLSCSITATDDDNDELLTEFTWTDEQGNVLSETDTLQLTPEIIQPEQSITCSVIVSDSEDSVESSSSVTTINTEPIIDDFVLTPPETTRVGDTLSCSASALDADKEIPSVVLNWKKNEEEISEDFIQTTESESTLQLDSSFFTDEDIITCTATATDSFNGTVSESQSVTIENTAPVIGSVSIDPANPFSQDTLTCTANDVTDIDGDDVTVTYTWTIDGEEQTLDPEQEQNMLFGPFTVGAIIMTAVFSLISIADVKDFSKMGRRVMSVYIVTFASTLFIGIQVGIFFGVIFNVITKYLCSRYSSEESVNCEKDIACSR